jgi:indole-3-glycerol phosphate synthase
MSFLNEVIALKHEEVAVRKVKCSLQDLKQETKDSDASAKPSFKEALNGSQYLSIIAEVKGASPSQGVIQETFDPLAIAQGYEKVGASAISVLTDQKYFRGDLSFLSAISQHVKIPCLQKDFIVDDYQVYESKLLGASAFLLIVRIMTVQQLQDLHGLGKELGLDVLVEIHDEEDLQKIEGGDFIEILGINNRNLDDMSVDIQRSVDLKSSVMFDAVLISESGLETKEDLSLMKNTGFDAVLMGTFLMRTGDPVGALRDLLDS